MGAEVSKEPALIEGPVQRQQQPHHDNNKGQEESFEVVKLQRLNTADTEDDTHSASTGYAYSPPVSPQGAACWGGWMLGAGAPFLKSQRPPALMECPSTASDIPSIPSMGSISSLDSGNLSGWGSPPGSPRPDLFLPSTVPENPAEEDASRRHPNSFKAQQQLVKSVQNSNNNADVFRPTPLNVEEAIFASSSMREEPSSQDIAPPPPPPPPPLPDCSLMNCEALSEMTQAMTDTCETFDLNAPYLAAEALFSGSSEKEEPPPTPPPQLLPLSPLEMLMDQAVSQESLGDLGAALECYQECLRLAAEHNSLLESAQVYHKIGVVHWKMGAYEDALELLRHAMQLYQDAFGFSTENEEEYIMENVASMAQTLSSVLNSLGRVFLSLGETKEAMRHLKQALALLQFVAQQELEDEELAESLGHVDENSLYQKRKVPCAALARTMMGMGMVYDARGQYNRAMKQYQKALQAQRACFGQEGHVDVAASLNSIGAIHEKRGEYDTAMDCYSEALVIYESQQQKNCSSPVDVAVTLNNMGFIHHLWGEYDCAMKSYTDAVIILESVLDPHHRNVASTKHNIGLVYAERGNNDRALQIYKDVLSSQRTSLGDEHPDVAVTLDSIASAYEHLNKLHKAIRALERALLIRTRALGKKHLFVGMTLYRMGQVALKEEDLYAAERHFNDAMKVYRANHLNENDCRFRQVTEYLQVIKEKRLEVHQQLGAKTTIHL